VVKLKENGTFFKTQKDPMVEEACLHMPNHVEMWDTSVLNHIKILNCYRKRYSKYKSCTYRKLAAHLIPKI